MYCRIVLVIKYRIEVFDTFVSGIAKEIFDYIAPEYNTTLVEWNHDVDHVHILFKEYPAQFVVKIHNLSLS